MRKLRFAVLVSNANPPNFKYIFNRIMDICEKKNTELNKSWRISMSIGHFTSSPSCNLSLSELLQKADEVLYKEKQKKNL